MEGGCCEGVEEMKKSGFTDAWETVQQSVGDFNFDKLIKETIWGGVTTLGGGELVQNEDRGGSVK